MPSSATISVQVWSVIFGVSSIRRIEVAGHAGGEAVRPDEDVDVRGRLGEVDGGLAGGVAATDDDHLTVAAQLRFDRRRAVVETESVEPGNILQWQPPVFRACGDDDDAG